MQHGEPLIQRRPLAMPDTYTSSQVTVIAAAIAAATADPNTVVERDGILRRDTKGGLWATFGDPLAYCLVCERCVAIDGSVWDTVPVLSPGMVACWPEDEAGRILHLQRDISVAGELAFGDWEPVWIGAPWCSLTELDHGSMPSLAATPRTA